MEEIKIRLTGGMMPEKQSGYAACYDVRCPEDYLVRAGRQIINLGFQLELPVGWHAEVRPRSGFSAKGFECEKRVFYTKDDGEQMVEIADVRIDADVILGTIDSDYRDNCGVILVCREPAYATPYFEQHDGLLFGGVQFVIPKGSRIAQLLIVKDEEEQLVEVSKLDNTYNRGGGFGHSGTK